MSYLEYFKLRREPFSNTPVSQFYYNSTPHAEALTRLNHAVSTMRGLAVLVGEIGAGKTTLARRLLDSLPENEYEASLLVMVHSEVTATWLLQRIALQLGVPAPEQEKLALLGQVYQRLLEIHQSGRKAVLLIDEAQMLQTRELMEEFRGLLNLELPEQKLITFVFFGLPELDHYLKLDPPLNQRVALRIHLSSLSADATEEYIKHRLRKAGATRMPFSSEAVAAIHRHSKGTPRLINTLCDNALLEAFLAQEQVVTQRLVDKVGEGLGLGEAVEDPLAPFQNSDLPPAEKTPSRSAPIANTPSPGDQISGDQISGDQFSSAPFSTDPFSSDPISSAPLSASNPDAHASPPDPLQSAQLTPALSGARFAQDQNRTANLHSLNSPQAEPEPEGTLPAIQHYSETTPVDDFAWPEYDEDPFATPAPEHSDFEASPCPDASQSADGGFEEYQEVNPEDVEYQGFEAQGFGAQEHESQGYESHDFQAQQHGSQDYGFQDSGAQDFGSQDFGSQDFGSQNFESQNFESQNFESPNYGSQNYGSQNFESQNFESQNFESQNFESQNFESQNFESQNFESPNYGSQNYGSQNYGSQNFETQDFGSQDSSAQNFGNKGFEAPDSHPVFHHGEDEHSKLERQEYGGLAADIESTSPALMPSALPQDDNWEYEEAGTQEVEESAFPSAGWELPEAEVADSSQHDGAAQQASDQQASDQQVADQQVSEQHISEWSMDPPPLLHDESLGSEDPQEDAEDMESAETDPHPLEGHTKSQD